MKQLGKKHRFGIALLTGILLLSACSNEKPQTDADTVTTGAVTNDVTDTVGQEVTAGGMIPVVSITAESLSGWTGKKDVRDAVLSYYDPESGEAFTREITIRPQGTSSLGYEKKNFTIEMPDAGVALCDAWGTQSKYCLKADFIDPTHAGNVVSAKLAAEMQAAYDLFPDTPNRGLVDGFPVLVFLNGENAGLYSWNIPKDAWMFGMDESNENHLVLCGENWSASAVFHADTFAVGEDWSFEAGEETPENIEKFNRLLRFINSASDEEFTTHFDEYLNLDACLNYYCFALISYGADNMGKNTLMVTYDGEVWAPSLYDLDSLWSVSWDGMGMMEDVKTLEAVATDGSNKLLYRLRTLFRDEFNSRYEELRGGILSMENIKNRFTAYCDAIPDICYALDGILWNPDGKYIRTLDLMFEETENYLADLDDIILGEH